MRDGRPDVPQGARIALTMRVTQAQGYREPRDSLSHDWSRILQSWGMLPLLIPNLLDDPTRYLTALEPDLMILTGGDDIGNTPERDVTETALLDHAMETGLPVLGVCRGLQLINHRFGGRLERVEGHVATRHYVRTDGGLKSLYAAGVEVNSFHRLAVPADGLGQGLVSGAIDADGRIEALHHETAAIAAVMWHPERPGGAAGDRLLCERLITNGAFWN